MKRSELSEVIVALFVEVNERHELTEDQRKSLLGWETDVRLAPLDRYTVGETYSCAREHSRAIRSFETALGAYHPDDAEWSMRGITLAKIGQGYFQLAQRTFDDGAGYDAAQPLYTKALESYEAAMRCKENINPRELPKVFCQMAISYCNSGKYADAQATCARFLASKEIHPFADPLFVSMIRIVAHRSHMAMPPAAKA